MFVEAFYILNKDKLSIQELDRADKLLHEFVARAQILFSKVSMTFNAHLLLHLARSVSEWGPLFSHNDYAFESFILFLLSLLNIFEIQLEQTWLKTPLKPIALDILVLHSESMHHGYKNLTSLNKVSCLKKL